MDKHNGLTGLLVALQAWAVGGWEWFISSLPTIILLMSAALTAVQLYVTIRDKLLKKGE